MTQTAPIPVTDRMKTRFDSRVGSRIDIRALTETLMLTAVMLACGVYLPWWSVIPPAFAYGFLRSGRVGMLRTVLWASALSSVIPAFIEDVGVGFRVSYRIAGIAHLPWRGLAYVVTGLIGILLGCLAVTVGSSLRAAVLQRGAVPTSVAGKREDSPAGGDV